MSNVQLNSQPNVPAKDDADTKTSREGSQAVTDALLASGVDTVFGYTGGSVAALTRSMFNTDLKMVGARTELGAAWMSYGYNRVKRRAASALVTWAVGALHAAPALMGAKQDGTPLLHLVADNPPAMEGRDSLQDSVDLYPSLLPLSKYNRKVTTAEDLPVIVRQAIKEASTGRFGPSVVHVAQTAMYESTTMAVEPLTLPTPPSPSAEDVAKTWELIRKAERPVFYVGAGVHVADAAAELTELAELAGVPVVSTSWGGRGLLRDDHALYAGPSGSFGWRSANDVLQSADFWLAIGTSFTQLSTGSWSLQKPGSVVHVDIHAYEVGKIFNPTLGVISDAKNFLRMLLEHARSVGGGPETTSWRDQVKAKKAEWLWDREQGYDGKEVPINQYFLIDTLSKELPDDTIVVGDSGANAFTLYRAFEYKSVTPMVHGSRYMSLGIGLPAAIGAKLAAPERTVVSYHGDGGFYYDFAELATLTDQGIKVIVILDDNRALMANRAGAKAAGITNHWAEVPENTDFVQVAAGLGVAGEAVTTPDELVPAIRRALEAEGSYLIDVHTDRELRLGRALSDVIPVVGDRSPKKGHLERVIEGSWPS